MQNFTPAQWLLIDLATQYGMDKDVYKERLSFGRDLLEHIKTCDFTDMVQLKEHMQPFIEKADEPEMFAKTLIAVSDVLAGKETGHFIGLDAVNSGPQLLSVLCRCITGMSHTGAVNVLDDNGEPVRPDTYTTIYKEMDTEVEVNRTQVKKVTVPYVYGSDAEPEKIFGEDAAEYVRAYSASLPWAYIMRQYIIGLWNPRADAHVWVAPDGFISYNPVMDTKNYSGTYKGVGFTFVKSVQAPKSKGKGVKSLVANVTHTYDGYIVREMHRRVNHDPAQLKKASRLIEMALLGDKGNATCIGLKRLEQLSLTFKSVSLEAVEYIEEGMLESISKDYLVQLNQLIHDVLSNPRYYLRTIHDQFDTHPNGIQVMRDTYNKLLVEAAKSDWLFQVVIGLGGDDLRPMRPELTDDMIDQIANNDYAIC